MLDDEIKIVDVEIIENQSEMQKLLISFGKKSDNINRLRREYYNSCKIYDRGGNINIIYSSVDSIINEYEDLCGIMSDIFSLNEEGVETNIKLLMKYVFDFSKQIKSYSKYLDNNEELKTKLEQLSDKYIETIPSEFLITGLLDDVHRCLDRISPEKNE